MNIHTITSRGQITLGKDIIEHLGVRPGQKVAIEKLPDGRIAVRAVQPRGHISDAFGLLKHEGGPRLTIEEISEAAARGWAGKR